MGLHDELWSPIGHYEPELLVLAPETGEDENTYSLVAQLLELGIAFELDENWHLPVAPPRDLSRYKACLFPDSARSKYEADLNAFNGAGGYVPDYKFYPTGRRSTANDTPFFISYARDVWFFSAAHSICEAGLTVPNPDFVRTLEARSLRSILSGLRANFFKEFGARTIRVWPKWGDPQCIQAHANVVAALQTGDAEWLDLAMCCLRTMASSADQFLAGLPVQSEPGARININVAMIAGMLMRWGTHFEDSLLQSAGTALGKRWCAESRSSDGFLQDRSMRYFWGESCMSLPCLYWLSRLTGEKQYAAAAAQLPAGRLIIERARSAASTRAFM